MKQTLSITRKELSTYFGSPMALIFIGAFLAATLFAFFWVDTFFARGIADVRPLFRWMPVLLIFLVAALTMRQWSEEQRAGTLEVLLTLPVSKAQLVLGKFLAVMALVALALALTAPLPMREAILLNTMVLNATTNSPATRGIIRRITRRSAGSRQPTRGTHVMR